MRSIAILSLLVLAGCRLIGRGDDAGRPLDGGVDAAFDAEPRPDAGPLPDAGPIPDTGRDAPDVAEPPRDRITSDCRFYSARRGEFIELHGDVQYVDAFADFEIEEVTSFPDLNVERVDAFPNDCGEWREVTSFPDFTVEVVDSFGDFDVRYVTAFPGLP